MAALTGMRDCRRRHRFGHQWGESFLTLLTSGETPLLMTLDAHNLRGTYEGFEGLPRGAQDE
jgi:hypothetical protein